MADLLKQSTAANIAVMMFATDGVTRLTGVSSGGLTVKAIKNDATEASVTVSSWTEVDSTNIPGVYIATIPAGVLDQLGTFVLSFKTSSSDFTIMKFEITGYLNDDLSVLLLRALGMLHENSVLDVTSFDSNNNLTAGRLRIYNSKANADAAMAASPGTYDTGKIGHYSITATYVGVNLATYEMARIFP